MIVNTFVGNAYVITTASGCTVSTPEGVVMLEAAKGQSSFVAISAQAVISDDDAVVTEAGFSVASFSCGGGGLTTLEAGVLRVMPIEGVTELEGGVMYFVTASESLDLSTVSLPAEDEECVTCELALEYPEGAMVLWPASWQWVSGVGIGSAPTLTVGKTHYFAIRTVNGETVINLYLTTDL